MDKSERVTGRRAMAQDCLFVLGDLLAEHALELRGRARARGRTRTYVRPTRRTYRYRRRTLAQPSHCLSASRSCQNRSLSFSRVCSCACRAGWPPGEGDLLTMLLSSGSLAPSVRFPETETSDWGCKRFAEACSTRNHDSSSSSSSRGPGCGWLSRLRRRDEARGRRGRAINVRGRLNVGVRWCSPCVHDTRLSAAQPRGVRLRYFELTRNTYHNCRRRAPSTTSTAARHPPPVERSVARSGHTWWLLRTCAGFRRRSPPRSTSRSIRRRRKP